MDIELKATVVSLIKLALAINTGSIYHHQSSIPQNLKKIGTLTQGNYNR